MPGTLNWRLATMVVSCSWVGFEMARFTCVAEPDDLWMVWDEQTSEPAMIGGNALIGLKHQRAETVCDVMERIETGKLTRKPTRLAS